MSRLDQASAQGGTMSAPAVAAAANVPDFRHAVACAIEAYAVTGRMRDAAIAYARNGIPVFPLSRSTKSPIPKRDPDPTARYPKGIPGTGGHLKATCDIDQVFAWWTKHPSALIGMPTGPRSGVWALDPDTTVDHEHDGVAAWHALQAKHGLVNTREHRTPTDGLHIIFRWNFQRPVSSKGHALPKGIDVKINGYIVVPPSRRKMRHYMVSNDADPAEPPEWLYALLPGRKTSSPSEQGTGARRNVIGHLNSHSPPPTVWHNLNRWGAAGVKVSAKEMPKFASALDFVPNDDLDYDIWIAFVLAIWASTGGSEEGYLLAERWSKKSAKFGEKENFRDRWEAISGSPPNETGPNKIYSVAIENGWEWQPTDRPRTTATAVPLSEAREALMRDMKRLVDYDKRVKNAFEIFAESVLGPTVRIIGQSVETGVGKSHAAIEALTASDKRFLYTVPTIALGGQIKQRFVERGVDVELFLGRGAEDPDREGQKMCRDLRAVAEAVEAMQPVQKTCCRNGKHVCRFFELCAYQKQFEKKPRGWIATSDTLFHRHRVFRKVQIIVIDESFVEKSLRGVAGDQIELPIKSLSEGDILARRLLGRDLAAQKDDGGLQRATIIGVDEDDPILEDDFLSRLKIAEWGRYKELSKRLGLLPGTRSRVHKKLKKQLISESILARQIIVVINEIQHLADHPKIKISGRLQIESIEGIRHITWRGLAPISKQFRLKPVMYLDATMPSKEILKPHFPRIEIKTARQVAIPESVFTLQVRRAPTSAEKLINGSHVEGHRREIKLYILQRWMELGCQATLVIAQKHFAEWLRAQKLPDNITVKHYNAVAGIDAFKNVRLQILLGRPQPGPEAIETLAATISGAMPDVIIDQNEDQFSWFDREPVGIRLRNGRVRMVKNDRHPDPFCEANRFLITEGELVQAYGRARPLNRTADSPLAIDLLFDNALPAIVDKVIRWEAPSRFIETAYSDGMMLLSPVDLTRTWSTIWSSKRTAERDVAAGVPPLPGFSPVTYRPKVAKAKGRIGYFDVTRVPDVARAVGERLGVPVEIMPRPTTSHL